MRLKLASALPTLGLLLNALVWGLSWWPFRHLQGLGVHPLWSTVLVYAAALLVLVAWKPSGVWPALCSPPIWILALAAGATNAAFNWAVSIGEVLRVVLLFYLMPLWSLLLGRWLLGEPLTPGSVLRVALALFGGLVVLKPPGMAWPWPSGLADVLGILGGMGFALNNIMLKRHAQEPALSVALGMFGGGFGVAGVLALGLSQAQIIAFPPMVSVAWLWPMGLLALAFLLGNLALQYGAARLPANVTAIIMLSEIVFASLSSVWIAGESLQPQLLVGGALILLASLLAVPWRSVSE